MLTRAPVRVGMPRGRVREPQREAVVAFGIAFVSRSQQKL